MRTREPGGTLLGERVREILLDGGAGRARAWPPRPSSSRPPGPSWCERVVPALAAGRWVVSDRFLDSSLAYQGAARGLGMDARPARQPAGRRRAPSRPLAGHRRRRSALATSRRCATPDRIEAEGDGFLERVAEGYHELARRFPERVRLVDGVGTPDEVHARVLAAVGDLDVIAIPGQPLAERVLRAALGARGAAPAAPAVRARRHGQAAAAATRSAWALMDPAGAHPPRRQALDLTLVAATGHQILLAELEAGAGRRSRAGRP